MSKFLDDENLILRTSWRFQDVILKVNISSKTVESLTPLGITKPTQLPLSIIDNECLAFLEVSFDKPSIIHVMNLKTKEKYDCNFKLLNDEEYNKEIEQVGIELTPDTPPLDIKYEAVLLKNKNGIHYFYVSTQLILIYRTTTNLYSSTWRSSFKFFTRIYTDFGFHHENGLFCFVN